MKKLLTILGLLISLAMSGQSYLYVAPDGSGNDSNDGSDSTTNAFATIGAACAAASAGDTVFVISGTHSLSSQVTVPVGVSIKGNGNSSVIVSSLATAYQYTFSLDSDPITDGNQTISYVKIDGDSETAFGAVLVQARNNVRIEHCTFVDFDDNGVVFNGATVLYRSDQEARPSAWITGCYWGYNDMSNCTYFGRPSGEGSGGLLIGLTDGMIVEHSTFDESSRGAGNCGYPIKFYNSGWNKNLKIRYNTINKLPPITTDPDGTNEDWNFAIEMWHWLSGNEVYENRIYGSIDVDRCEDPDGVGYSVKIYDNTFGYDAITPAPYYPSNCSAIFLETPASPNALQPFNGVYIFRNIIQYVGTPFEFSTRQNAMRDIYIYLNIVRNIGHSGTFGGGGNTDVFAFFSQDGVKLSNINVWNNIFHVNPSATTIPNGGFKFPDESIDNMDVDSVTIANNVFQGIGAWAVRTATNATSSVNALTVMNNCFYDNGTDGLVESVNASTNLINTGNITTIPGFTTPGSDFTVASTSSNIYRAGTTIPEWMLTTDYAGNLWTDPPSIGAYELGTSPPEPPAPVVKKSHAITGGSMVITVNGKPVILKL